MEVISFKSKVQCAAGGCKNYVRNRNTEKKILCRKCWHEKIEKAALTPPSMMHVAFTSKQHEMMVIDPMKEFLDSYDIEYPEGYNE